jgi:hypothetical protein
VSCNCGTSRVSEFIRAADYKVIKGVLEAIVYRKNAVVHCLIRRFGLLFFLFFFFSERIEVTDAELSLYLLRACGLSGKYDIYILLEAKKLSKSVFNDREVFFFDLCIFKFRISCEYNNVFS